MLIIYAAHAASRKVILKEALNDVINTKDNKIIQTASALFLGIKKNKSNANQFDDRGLLKAINLQTIIITKTHYHYHYQTIIIANYYHYNNAASSKASRRHDDDAARLAKPRPW